jgi:hypothetical protein
VLWTEAEACDLVELNKFALTVDRDRSFFNGVCVYFGNINCRLLGVLVEFINHNKLTVLNLFRNDRQTIIRFFEAFVYPKQCIKDGIIQQAKHIGLNLKVSTNNHDLQYSDEWTVDDPVIDQIKKDPSLLPDIQEMK